MSDSNKEEILNRKLDDEQLENVPGGGCKGSPKIMITCKSDVRRDQTCFYNDWCNFLWNDY